MISSRRSYFPFWVSVFHRRLTTLANNVKYRAKDWFDKCMLSYCSGHVITGTDQNRITNINRYMCPLFSSIEVRIQGIEM